MQTGTWICRFGGSLVGTLSGGWLMSYGKLSPAIMFLINGLVPVIVLLPAVLILEDTIVAPTGSGGVAGMRNQLLLIWKAVQMNGIWKPMLFVFMFAVTPSRFTLIDKFERAV
jgi:hypothetical protein